MKRKRMTIKTKKIIEQCVNDIEKFSEVFLNMKFTPLQRAISKTVGKLKAKNIKFIRRGRQ